MKLQQQILRTATKTVRSSDVASEKLSIEYNNPDGIFIVDFIIISNRRTTSVIFDVDSNYSSINNIGSTKNDVWPTFDQMKKHIKLREYDKRNLCGYRSNDKQTIND